jgi:hypothetical protein
MMHFENPGPSLNFRKGWGAVIRCSARAAELFATFRALFVGAA